MSRGHSKEAGIFVCGIGITLVFSLAFHKSGAGHSDFLLRVTGVVLAVTAVSWLMSVSDTRKQFFRRLWLGLLGAALPVFVFFFLLVAVCGPAHCLD